MVVLGQSCKCRSKWLNTGKMVVFRQSGCFRAEIVLIGQKWSYLGKSCCIQAKWLYSVKSGCILSKVVVFGQKLLYSGKLVVF